MEVRRAGAPAAAGERLARAVKGTFPSALTPSAKLCGRTGSGAAHTACCVQGVSADSSQLVFSRLAARGIRRGGERWAREGVELLGADTMAAIVWSWAEGGGGRHVLEAV